MYIALELGGTLQIIQYKAHYLIEGKVKQGEVT